MNPLAEPYIKTRAEIQHTYKFIECGCLCVQKLSAEKRETSWRCVKQLTAEFEYLSSFH